MTLELDDGRYTYLVTTTCGRPSEVLRLRKYDHSHATPVDWSEVPFLVQQAIEVRLQECMDGVPNELWRR